MEDRGFPVPDKQDVGHHDDTANECALHSAPRFLRTELRRLGQLTPLAVTRYDAESRQFDGH